MGIISRTTNEVTPIAKSTLKRTKELAEETIKSVVISLPHHGLKTTSSSNDTLQHVELIKALGNAERNLMALSHRLESLAGNDDPEGGLLAEWTNYQSSPGYPDFLSNPNDILDRDLDFIDSCLDVARAFRVV